VALKDLVIDYRQVAEETIEKIVSPYIHYDAGARKIVLTPQSKSLGNEARVLVYLVAVLGWQYVLDEEWKPPTKPADLENELRIVGGTLRPILKNLKDAHLVAVLDGHYRAQSANLDSIELAIAGEMPRTAARRPTRTPQRAARGGQTTEESDPPGDLRQRKKRGTSGQLKALLLKWRADGFFNEPRTLADLFGRYHEHGVIAKQTSLSGLVLGAVREGLLTRTRADVGGKQVWLYATRPAG
jgi:hypothetical protein